MGRELKRVPLNFEYPLGKVWEGYCPTIETFQNLLGSMRLQFGTEPHLEGQG